MSRTRAVFAASATLAAGALLAGALPSSDAASPLSAHLTRALQGPDSGDFPGAEVPLGSTDHRGPALPRLGSAVSAVHRLGDGIAVSSWTRYGTPLSVLREKGYLASGMTGSPSQVARDYLRAHAAVWGLSAADVDGLRVVENAPLSGSSTAWSVSFNQVVDGILVAQDGYVVVGVVGDKVAGVTSSLVPTSLLGQLSTTTPKLSVQQAVLAAAKDAGITHLSLSDLSLGKLAGDLQSVKAAGLHQLQYARVRVVPTTDRGARLVYETAVQDVAGGRALAAQSQVDALTGKVLLRHDAVNTLAAIGDHALAATPGTFSGTYGASCSTPAVLGVKVGDRTLAVSAASADPSDDITITVLRKGVAVGTFDTATSPEAGTVSFSPAIAAADLGKVTASVCPYDGKKESGQKQFVGNYVSTDQVVPAVDTPAPPMDGTLTGPATWLAFGSNPSLPRPGVASKDDRYELCSGKPGATNPLGKDLSRCAFTWGGVGGKDLTGDFPSPYAYDISPLGISLNTTQGNNAITTNAQLSTSLTAGPPAAPPTGGGTRDYGRLATDTFKDTWHTARCNPASLLPTGGSADVNAAIVNLFVGHNRIHDFSYRLGLTEPRGAMQLSNFGKADGVPGAQALDPETGNAQNAALTNDAFAVSNQATTPAAGVGLTGRDNANQISLMDGVPGITNQYLFQPVVGFYSPCTDGDLDASVFLHEYTHAISNRLIAGPATGLGGQQGGSMGESWSDLDAIEYLNAFDLAGKRGEDKFALGAYATGDPVVGIRDFNLAPSKNPLNYSDFGFDSTGPEVHADGEVWNAVQMTVRQALVDKYEPTFHYGDKKLQKACALGRYDNGTQGPAWNRCPGNRRWITYMYDAMINQANGKPSMVDMRDATLISVMMRDPKDYDTVADAFASRGLGAGAKSKSSDDLKPVPSFASPKASHNARATFTLVDANTGAPVKGTVFVGEFTARCRGIASTLGAGHTSPTASIVAGRYTLSVQAKGYGIQRFTETFTPGARTVTLRLAQNLVSGRKATGNAGALRLANVVDDAEGTNGAFTGQPVAGRTVTVPLGGTKTFQKLAFSSLHHPAQALKDGTTEVEGRLLGVRAFDVQASGDGGKTFRTVYRSPNDFFPAGAPRATAPDLVLRSITLPKPITADAVRLVVRSNTCTGGPDFNHEQEDDPTNPSDCRSTATNTTSVTVSELEVFRALSTAGAIVIAPGHSSPAFAGPARLAATGLPGGTAVGGLGALLAAAWVFRRRAQRV